MNNAKKGLKISATILALTLGVFVLKNYVFAGPAGLKVPTIIDFVLALPALPFLTLIWVFPNNIPVITTLSFILSIIFWLSVGYFIGARMDRK